MAQSDSLPVVLHVVDRNTGGVPVAVKTYIGNSAYDARHLVVVPGGELAQGWADVPAELIDLGEGLVRRVWRVRQLFRAHRPDAVHAHSSFSGVYTRLAVRAGRSAHVVYSPHCFAFERTDLSTMKRWLFRCAERILARNTSVIAACGTAEATLARALSPRRVRTLVVPNVASIRHAAEMPIDDDALRIRMIGRICPQKDPVFFAETVATFRERGIKVEPAWIGDGAADDQASLEAAGIRVTGWIASKDLEDELAEANFYLHSAAWEGFPIAVIDAYVAGLPILVRRINAFRDLPGELTVEDGLGALLDALTAAEFEAWARRNLANWSMYLRDNNPVGQRAALLDAWSAD